MSNCPYMKKCGGCDRIDKPYGEQLKAKQQQVEKLIGPMAGAGGCRIEKIIGAEDPLFYRNKVHAVFDRDSKGHIIRGLYREETHDVVDITGCLLEDRDADAIIEEIRRLLPSFRIRTYDEDTGYGLLRHVLVRTGHVNGRKQIMVVLVTADPIFPSKNNFSGALRKKFPDITTIVQNINSKRTSMVLGSRNVTIYGKGYIEDELMGLKFRISPASFYQINHAQTEKLYSKALEYAGLSGREYVLDAYCGTGTIGMLMAGRAKKVTGVELNADAVRDAVNNARANSIKNISFINEDATRYMQLMAGNDSKIDLLCMDPPRSGSTPEFINAAAALEVKRVVYVSCNPETLVRDLQLFAKKGYRLDKACPVDMFPGTGHVECVVLLSRV